MNGTTNPTMTATQKRTSSQREENGGVIAMFINQFPPIDWFAWGGLGPLATSKYRGELPTFAGSRASSSSLIVSRFAWICFLAIRPRTGSASLKRPAGSPIDSMVTFCAAGCRLSQISRLDREWRIRLVRELLVRHKLRHFEG